MSWLSRVEPWLVAAPKPVWTPNQIVAYRIHEARRMMGLDSGAGRGRARALPRHQALDSQLLGHRAILRRRPHPPVQRRRDPGAVPGVPAPHRLVLHAAAADRRDRHRPRPTSTPTRARAGTRYCSSRPSSGNPDTLPEWEEALREWAVSKSGRIRYYSDSSGEYRLASKHLDERVDTFLKTRARVRLGELLGDVDRAKDVLAGLVELLDELDDVDAIEAGADDPA